MRILISILFAAFTLSQTPAQAQYVTIPDPNFVSWLTNYGFAPAMNGNDLDTTHNLVTSATTINCPSSGITDLTGIEYFNNLYQLNCSYNNLSSLPELPPNVGHLYFSGNSIAGTLTLPPYLEYLDCVDNQITNITSLPLSLQYIDCRNNQISQLPALPNSLMHLSCPMNLLNSVPSLPSGLQFLDCSLNALTSLPVLPNSLGQLYCLYNSITALPVLPNFLQLLNCNSNSISNLPTLPNSLINLSCSQNLLSTLPSLPTGLSYLECSWNQLSSFSSLPPSLDHLQCDNNILTSLPVLPSTLFFLQANNNQISLIPNFPVGLTDIALNNNSLTSIPALPDQIGSLLLNNNPALSCLPELTTISGLNFLNTNVQCIPNYGSVTGSQPNLNSLPLCDIFSANGCDFYYNIAGQIYGDNNANCIQEFDESLFSGIKVNLFQSGNLIQQVLSSQMGLYTFDCNIGTFELTVDTAGVPFEVGCPLSGIQNSAITVADSIDLGMDFGLQCKPGFDIGIISVSQNSGLFFPADTALIQIKAGDMSQFFNLSCSNGISGTVTVNFTGPAQYAGNVPGSLIPTFTPNTLTYAVPDFGTIDINTAFRFYLVTDTMAQNGQLVCITADVTPVSGDNVPANNNLSHCFGILNSFDPNHKEVSPIDSIYQFTEWLTYTIRFQNTGTAAAQHVVLTDTLSSNLEEGTFNFLGSSHNPFINVTGNVVKFTFPNINLPDSTSDEANSHGYVQFKVKPDAGLPIGSTIANTAAIYFDFNPPVITNTTINTVIAPTGIQENNSVTFSAYPNPADENVNIYHSKSGIHRLSLTDFAGRIVFDSEFTGNEHKIDVSRLVPGMYFVQLESEHQKHTMKIVVK